MKYVIPFFLLMITSCAQQKMNSNKKAQDIAWIKEIIEKTKESPFPTKVIISQYQFQGATVYLVDQCYQCPDGMSILYNEKKEKLSTFGGMMANLNKYPNFFEEATDKKVIWKSFKE